MLSRQPQINVAVAMGIKAANSPKQSRSHYYSKTVVVSIQPSVSVTCSSVGYVFAILAVTGIVCMKAMRISAWVTFISKLQSQLNCKLYHFKFISLMCSYVHSTSFVPRPERGRGKRAWCPLLVHVLNCAEIPLAPQTIHLYLYTRADTQHYFLSHFQEKQNFIL